MSIPAGLIMKITQSHMEVFLKSDFEENPYPDDGCDTLGHGLYCETVIGRDNRLLVEDALSSEVWKDNPDVAIDMISYLGFPIKWPDNEFFGTICVLDSKANSYSKLYSQLLEEFRNTIELDLDLLLKRKELNYYAETDLLTNTYNRRKIEALANTEFKRSARSKSKYGLVLFDLDKFKNINDTYGHDIGDQVLETFSLAIKNRIRATDVFGRWGGDEFVLICPDTDDDGMKELLKAIKPEVLKQIKAIIPDADYSYGFSVFTKTDTNYSQIIKRADIDMYNNKGWKNK